MPEIEYIDQDEKRLQRSELKLKYNLGTGKYCSSFMDAYGCYVIVEDKFRHIAVMEMFGG